MAQQQDNENDNKKRRGLRSVLENPNTDFFGEPKDDSGESVRTMKCSLDATALGEEERKKLDRYLKEFDDARRTILKDFYEQYNKGYKSFLAYCARVKDTSESKKGTTYIPVEGLSSKSKRLDVQGQVDYEIMAYKRYSNKRKEFSSEKPYFFAEGGEARDKKIAFKYSGKVVDEVVQADGKVKEVKADINNIHRYWSQFRAEDFDLKSGKEISQELGNRVSALITEKKLLKHIKTRGGLQKIVAENLASFCKKLMEAEEGVKKSFDQKKKLVELLKGGSSKDHLEKQFLESFKEQAEKDEYDRDELEAISPEAEGDLKKVSDRYNRLIKAYNQVANRAIQRLDKSKEEEKKLREEFILKPIKKVPSFPLIGKDDKEEKLKKDPKSVLEDLEKDLNKFDREGFKVYDRYPKTSVAEFDDFINNKVAKFAEELAEAKPRSRGEGSSGALKKKWAQDLVEASKESIAALLWRRLNLQVDGKQAPEKNWASLRKNLKDKPAAVSVFQSAYHFLEKSPEISNAELIKKLVDDVCLKKMEGLKKHLSEPSAKSDLRGRRMFADYGRFAISFVAEALKQRGDKKQARELELLWDDNMGVFQGSAFELLKQKEDSKVLRIDGFNFDSERGKKGAAIVFRNEERTKKAKGKKRKSTEVFTKWYLALSAEKLSIHFKKVEKDEELKLHERITDYPTGEHLVLCWVAKGNQKKHAEHQVSYLDMKRLEKNGGFLIPINLGVRQAREVLYNLNCPTRDVEQHKRGVAFRSAEIQRVQDGKQQKYFLNLNWSRLKAPRWALEERKGFVGVDRGDVTTAWAAVVDGNGNLIFDGASNNKGFLQLGKGFLKTYNKKWEAYRERQSRGSSKTGSFLKNSVEKWLQRVAAELLRLAVEGGYSIVLEDLSRGFGRGGKKTFMGINNQYTKMIDFLEVKLRQNKIGNGGKKGESSKDEARLLNKVWPAYTSLMCSQCGRVNSINREGIVEDMIAYLNDEGGKLYAGYPGYYERFAEKNPDERGTNKEKLRKNLRNYLNPRKDDSENFVCTFCEFQCNADQQASLNIARFAIFFAANKKESGAKKNKGDYVGYLESKYGARLGDGRFSKYEVEGVRWQQSSADD